MSLINEDNFMLIELVSMLVFYPRDIDLICIHHANPSSSAAISFVMTRFILPSLHEIMKLNFYVPPFNTLPTLPFLALCVVWQCHLENARHVRYQFRDIS
jgi:hypothetical protein